VSEEVCRIEVPWDLAKTSKNALPSHHMARHQVVKAARLAGYRAWEDAGHPRLRRKVRVHLVFRTGVQAKQMDQANLWGAAAPLVDGVFVGLEYFVPPRGKGRKKHRFAAMLPDDTRRWLETGRAEFEIAPEHAGRETVLFIVESLED
jgi:hypothetical protein